MTPVNALPDAGHTAARSAARKALWAKAAMGVPLALLLGVFFVYPVGRLLLLSVWGEQGATAAHYRQLFGSPVYVNVLLITLKLSLLTTAFAVVVGYPVAYLAARVPREAQARLLFWVLLSFWTSFLVRAFAWIVLLGRNGVINQILTAVGAQDQPASLLYHAGSVLVGMVHALLPLAILTLLAVMDNIDRTLPGAAATLGARPGTAFWKVYFPLSLPGVAAAGVMVFVTALGFFIVPALLGSPRETMIGQLIIDQVQQTLNWGFAGAISVLLIAAVLPIFIAYDRVIGLSTMAGGNASGGSTVHRFPALRRMGDAVTTLLGRLSDLPFRMLPRLVRMPSSRTAGRPDAPSWGLSTFVWGVLLAMSLPAFLMIPLSFSASGLNWPPHGWTLHWYQDVLQSPVWTRAILRSLAVALGTGVLSMALGAPMAFLLVRGGLRGQGALLAFVLTPILVPRIILAVGLFYLFARIGLVGSAWGLILGHTVIAVPYVVITMVAVLRNYDRRLDLAAMSLGARPLATLRYVTLPVLGAGMLSSFLFAFATSFDELTIALFATGGVSATLPKQFWDEVTLQVSPAIAAVSTCLLLFLAGLIAVAERLRRRAAAR